jgi:hypothetical protein
MVEQIITAERLRELLHYDPDTGVFTWKVDHPNRRAGSIAGTQAKHEVTSYRMITADGRRYYAHRLAWLYMTGEWPAHEIDHLSGDGIDNRWCNLRDVTKAINQQNLRVARAHSATGLLGAFPLKRKNAAGKLFFSTIVVDGKATYLGTFYTPDEAHAAYLAAKRALHAGCTI